MIRDAVADVVPILGTLPRVADLVMRERHLGLHLPHEARQDYVDQLTALIEQHVDLDRLLEVSLTRRPPQPPRRAVSSPTVRVGVARDEAFCFYIRR